MAVRESGVLESDVGPAIIHCSAGIGRSGTFCLVDSCLILVCTKATIHIFRPGCIAQSVGHLTGKSEVLGSIPGLATYFHFSFR